ncbi:hypothetical protein AV944_18125 (plasmid) [Sphingomonas sp. LK11]|nr:hypothetical protein AV944_18125 [Sphingomonas sp. LK11]
MEDGAMGYFGKYDTPTDLLADENLSVGEKIELLESWRDDKEAYMRAAGEGMQGPSRSEALRLIENALISLRGE